MDEGSFQWLLQLSSQCIPFQAPSVVSEKVCTPLALVAHFHNANVLVNALTLLLTQISTVFGKQSKCDRGKCSLTFVPRVGWNSSVALQFTPRIPHSDGFVTIDFSDCQVNSSASLRASSNIGSFMSSLIWEPSNIQVLSFSMPICGNFSWRKANSLPSLSTAPGTNRHFCFRREPSSWADSFERFRSRVKSLRSACVKGSGWSSSSGLYASSPATAVMSLCSESELYSMLPSRSGTWRSWPSGIGLMTEGT